MHTLLHRALPLLCALFATGSYAFETPDLATTTAAPGQPLTSGSPFIRLDTGFSPGVAYALEASAETLSVTLAIAAPRQEEVAVELGLAGATAIRLSTLDAASAQLDGNVRMLRFDVPKERLGSLDTLRMATAIGWHGGPYGELRQRERFRHLRAGAPHAGLAASPEAWAPLDLQTYQDAIAGNDRIRLSIEQPMDGKLTVVLEDAQGNRLRNLVGGQPTQAGRQTIEWDGLDDAGRLVPPGSYRWRSAHHPGITTEYLFNFANMGVDGTRSAASNHGQFTAACSTDERVFLAASITEGGWAIVALDADGTWRQGYQQQHGTGYAGVAIAADGTHLYAINDGTKKNRDTDTTQPDWKVAGYLTLTKWKAESGELVRLGGDSFVRIAEYEHGPGATTPGTHAKTALTGAALVGDALYVASRAEQALLVLDPASGTILRTIPLPEPGALAAADGALFAISGQELLRIAPESGEVTHRFASGAIDVAGIAVHDGRLYLSDRATHTVVITDLDGKRQGQIGEPGGAYAGTFQPRRLIRPSGLAVFADKLWVTESRRNPKRVTAWDLASRELLLQHYGNPPYGSPGVGIDPQQPRRWIGSRATWEVDYESATATVTSILQKEGGHMNGEIAFCTNYQFHRQDGRTFVIGQDRATIISELMPDGSLRDLAVLSHAHGLLYAMNWSPSPGFQAAMEAKFPRASVQKKYAGSNKWRNATVLWIDENGDGEAQQEEYQIGDESEELWGTGWGLLFHDLSMRFVVKRPDGQEVLVALRPDGYHPGGAPRYPTLSEAIATAPPLTATPIGVDAVPKYHATVVDSRGNLIFNSDPMVAYSPAGELLWHYPNQWVNVHGSHKAPLPSVGEMQGNLFFMGIAPLDAESDVTITVGNHGRFFVITSDGIYLDELFRDTRIGGPSDTGFVGGEAFGGVFEKVDDGRYLMSTGPGGYRVYQVHGFDQVERQSGEIQVTPRQLELAAQRRRNATETAAGATKATIPFVSEAPTIDGKDGDWPAAGTATWDRDGRFRSSMRAAYDADHLYLLYSVSDPSPWRNTGDDWQTLFKTGDAVDFQIGTNPAARSNRREAAPGDVRLLIAPFKDEIIAVLYRFRTDHGENPVRYDSPWRSYQVDDVIRLDGVNAAVETHGSGYRLEAAVPLAALGLDPGQGTFTGDVGVLFSNAEGSHTALRSYWANPHTGLMYDVPGEAMITPHAWGTLTFQPQEAR